jgi:hypothetical protein
MLDFLSSRLSVAGTCVQPRNPVLIWNDSRESSRNTLGDHGIDGSGHPGDPPVAESSRVSPAGIKQWDSTLTLTLSMICDVVKCPQLPSCFIHLSDH